MDPLVVLGAVIACVALLLILGQHTHPIEDEPPNLDTRGPDDR